VAIHRMLVLVDGLDLQRESPLPVVPGAFLHRPSGEMIDAMCCADGRNNHRPHLLTNCQVGSRHKSLLSCTHIVAARTSSCASAAVPIHISKGRAGSAFATFQSVLPLLRTLMDVGEIKIAKGDSTSWAKEVIQTPMTLHPPKRTKHYLTAALRGMNKKCLSVVGVSMVPFVHVDNERGMATLELDGPVPTSHKYNPTERNKRERASTDRRTVANNWTAVGRG
jgi:hypothetical protein